MLSKKTLQLSLLSFAITCSVHVQASNIVSNDFYTQVLSGDNNSVSGVTNPAKARPQIIVGNDNTLVDTNASQVFGQGNSLNKSDVVVTGQGNVVENTFGNIYGDGNVVDTGVEYGRTNVYGTGSKVNGENNSSFGDKTVVTANNTVTLGNNSTNDRDNTVSVGSKGNERQITNVATATEGTDAINLNQLNEKSSETLSSAISYADTNINNAKNELQLEITSAKNDAVVSSGAYTDEQIKQNNSVINQTISTAKNDAVASSGAYTDEQIKQNNSVINQTISTAKNDAVADSNNFTEFKYSQSIDYAKNAALTSEKNANAYTDEKFRQMDKNVNSKFRGLNNKIEQAEKRLNAGLAGVTALASIPYINDSHFSYGIGLGNYKNGNALAAGVQLKIADSASLRLNTSWDSSNNSVIGIGIAGGL